MINNLVGTGTVVERETKKSWDCCFGFCLEYVWVIVLGYVWVIVLGYCSFYYSFFVFFGIGIIVRLAFVVRIRIRRIVVIVRIVAVRIGIEEGLLSGIDLWRLRG